MTFATATATATRTFDPVIARPVKGSHAKGVNTTEQSAQAGNSATAIDLNTVLQSLSSGTTLADMWRGMVANAQPIGFAPGENIPKPTLQIDTTVGALNTGLGESYLYDAGFDTESEYGEKDSSTITVFESYLPNIFSPGYVRYTSSSTDALYHTEESKFFNTPSSPTGSESAIPTVFGDLVEDNDDQSGRSTTPPSTPVDGLSYAEDNGLHDDLLNLMFDSASYCVLPDELHPEYSREGFVPFWAENVYVESENDLVGSPLEMEDC